MVRLGAEMEKFQPLLYKKGGKRLKKLKKVFGLIAAVATIAMVCVATGCATKDELKEQLCTHQYDGGKVTKASTCVEEGETTYTCIECGHTVTEKRPLLEHAYDDGQITIEATCTEVGELTYTCEDCGAEKTQEIPMVEHNLETVSAVVATCETVGYTEWTKCSDCDAIIVPTAEIPALGHTEVADLAVGVTCTTSGKTEGSHCGACGKVFVAQTVIPATGHTPVTLSGKSPTCITSGFTSSSTCSDCGVVLQEKTELVATGHTDTDSNYCCDICGAVSDFDKFYSISGNYTEVDVEQGEMLSGGVYRVYKDGRNMDGNDANGNECWFISDGNAYTHQFLAPESYEGMVFGFGDGEWSETEKLYFFAGNLRDTAAYGVDAVASAKIETVGITYNYVITEDNKTCYVDMYFESGATITIANADGSKSYTINVDELIWHKPYGIKRLVVKTATAND